VEALTIGGEAVLPTKEADVPDLTTTVGKEQAAAVKRNAIAMANLTMAFTSEATMGLVFKAKTTEWPSGLAHLVVSGLNKKYNPQDTISRVELRQRLSAIRMKKNEDPTTLFEQISSIENKYNTSTRHIEEEDLIAVVLDAAPQEYQSLLTTEQRIKGASITLSDLDVIMGQYWRQTKSAREKSGTSGDDSEFSLTTFDGKCFRCGKYGHMGRDCPEDSRLKIRRTRIISRITVRNGSTESALFAVRKGTWQKIVGRKKRTQTKDRKDGNPKWEASTPMQPWIKIREQKLEWKFYLMH
jgi:hypothetical protein